MKKNLLSSILLIAASTGCSFQECPTLENKIDNHSIVLTKNDFAQPLQMTSVKTPVGKYEQMLKNTDASLHISSSRDNPRGEERVVTFYNPPFQGIQTKSNPLFDQNSIFVDGFQVFGPKTKSGEGIIKEKFGSRIQVSLGGPATKTTDLPSVELYVPEIVQIAFPSIHEDEDFPLCYYQDYVVRWNPDSDNSNGIIICVKWIGLMVYGDDYPSTYVQHYICVPDNGFVSLDEDMFEGIPDSAFCSLYVLRGDVEMLNSDGVSLNVVAETHDSLNFVLIRNVVENEE